MAYFQNFPEPVVVEEVVAPEESDEDEYFYKKVDTSGS